MRKRMELAHIIRHFCTRCALHVGMLERELEAYMSLSDRELMMEIAWKYLGVPYKWGGDDPSGFDCSGLVVECLQSIGLVGVKEDLTAQMLWNRFIDKEVPKPYEGCLVFWDNDRGDIIHVEICINDRLSIGAKGGGSQVLTVKDAIEHNAFIKVRPFNNRKGIAGFLDPLKE